MKVNAAGRVVAGAMNPNWKGGPIDKTCAVCAKQYVAKRAQEKSRFCSLQCVGISQRGKTTRGSRAEPAQKHPPVKKECIICRAAFYVYPAHINRKLCCTPKCGGILRSRTQSGPNNYNWMGGLSRQGYPWGFKFISRVVRKRDGFACQNPNCEGRGHLTTHHIDYDKSNCAMENLIALCASCNSKANYRREEWRKFYSDIIAIKRAKGGGWEREEFS